MTIIKKIKRHVLVSPPEMKRALLFFAFMMLSMLSLRASVGSFLPGNSSISVHSGIKNAMDDAHFMVSKPATWNASTFGNKLQYFRFSPTFFENSEEDEVVSFKKQIKKISVSYLAYGNPSVPATVSTHFVKPFVPHKRVSFTPLFLIIEVFRL